MKSTLALSTRIGVAVLISLALVTAAVTAFVVGNPRTALSRVTAPAIASATPAPTSTPSGSAIDQQALVYAQDVLVQASASEASDWPERDLEDLLPNRLFSFDGSDASPLAAAIVVGTVTDAREGAALDAVAGSEVAFDAPEATARIVVLSISVAVGLGDASGAQTVDVGVHINGTTDPELLLKGMASLGTVIAVLDEQGAFDFAPEAYESRGGARLLGSVDADGLITFPASESGFVGALTTVDSVVEASARTALVGETADGKVTGP